MTPCNQSGSKQPRKINGANHTLLLSRTPPQPTHSCSRSANKVRSIKEERESISKPFHYSSQISQKPSKVEFNFKQICDLVTPQRNKTPRLLGARLRELAFQSGGIHDLGSCSLVSPFNRVPCSSASRKLSYLEIFGLIGISRQEFH